MEATTYAETPKTKAEIRSVLVAAVYDRRHIPPALWIEGEGVKAGEN